MNMGLHANNLIKEFFKNPRENTSSLLSFYELIEIEIGIL